MTDKYIPEAIPCYCCGEDAETETKGDGAPIPMCKPCLKSGCLNGMTWGERPCCKVEIPQMSGTKHALENLSIRKSL